MIKKSLFFCTLIMSVIFSGMATAKTKECLVRPSYDITVTTEFVQVVNKQNNLIITPSGSINLNERELKIKPKIQQEAKQFQSYLRKQLPLFENKAYVQLDDVRAAFQTAVREKLGNKSELLKHINNLHRQLVGLLNKSIITCGDTTYFYHEPFNNIKKDGEEIGEDIFYKIIGDSLIKFNIFKNYSTVKKIAKQEWKTQKVILKAFDEDVCNLLTDIDDQYNHLMIGLYL